MQSYGVGAKAGDKLRDDAVKSLIYAIFLIMLYLAFRFDIRYAPGAAFATIHDAVMVIGVFAVTWTEVSLTSVAGLLTVMGFSVNDTVIVFDRIRENQAKLKDKKLERIIDISLNEMLVRSILTSATVFATTLIMNIFGDGPREELRVRDEHRRDRRRVLVALPRDAVLPVDLEEVVLGIGPGAPARRARAAGHDAVRTRGRRRVTAPIVRAAPR